MRKENTKILTPLFLLVAIFLVSVFYSFNRAEDLDIRSLAFTDEEVARYCVNPPECCAAISKTRDAHECEWPIRGFCRNCGDIEGPNERCGWYWIWHDANGNEYKLGTNGEKGYGCMIGDSPSTMRPIYNADGSKNTAPTVAPTIPVQPTAIPTSIPIPTVVSQPTLPPTLPPLSPVQPTQAVEPPRTRPQITYIPIVVPPYTPPTVTPTPTPFRLNLPKILPPKEEVQTFLKKVKSNLQDFFSKILP